MKNKKSIIILCIIILIVVSCVFFIKNSKNNSTASEDRNTTSSEVKKDIPEGTFSNMGKGTVIISTPSGTSENGNIPVIFMDESELAGKPYEMQADLGLSARGFDGSKITNIYVDGFSQCKEQLADTDTAIYVSATLSTIGKHKVELIQFDDNNNVVTYKSAEYEIKSK